MSSQRKCEVSVFAENIEGLKFSMSRQLEDVYSRVKARGQKFTELDSNEYRGFLQRFWVEQAPKIEAFFFEKFRSKSYTFDTEIKTYNTNFEALLIKLEQQSDELNQCLDKQKSKDLKKEKLVEHAIEAMQRFKAQNKAFNLWKNFLCSRRNYYKTLSFCRQHYRKRLLNKVTGGWKRVAYQECFQARVSRKTGSDLRRIEEEYLGIVATLKNKIAETEELIRIKRLAKSEFAYSLSRNLLKTISNLSMEVMTLNQLSLNDTNVDDENTFKFLENLNEAINSKYAEINHLKKNIVEEQTISISYGKK